MPRKIILICEIILFAFLGIACNLSTSTTFEPTETIPAGLPLDPFFREVYGEYFGGAEILGAPISAKLREDNTEVQYLESAKIVYNPQSPSKKFFELAPLGVELGIHEPDVPPPSSPNVYYVNGHIIDPEFYEVYERLGKHVVGLPLTESRFNLVHQRYEQYFENLGFYRFEGDKKVRTLKYGVWVCKEKCPYQPTNQAAIPDRKYKIAPVFKDVVNKYGADFTGLAISDVFTNGAGQWEQIFENVVLQTNSLETPDSTTFSSLPEKVGIKPETPRKQQENSEFLFYPISGDLGYEIPAYFQDYIGQNDRTQVVGSPISHYTLLDGQIYHQCFTNLCLTYDLNAYEGARIRPEPLGYSYMVLYPPIEIVENIDAENTIQPQESAIPPELITVIPDPATQLGNTQTLPEGQPTDQPAVIMQTPLPSLNFLREISMFLWEREQLVDPGENQEIGLRVTENDQPLVSAVPEIIYVMPDGIEKSLLMPPTSGEGKSSTLLPPIQAPIGSIISYKVCITASDKLKVCVSDHFVIFQSP